MFTVKLPLYIFITIAFILVTSIILVYMSSSAKFDEVISTDSEYDDEDEDTSYSFKPGSVCCLVLTSPSYLFTRAHAINQTWGSRCDRLFFITESSQNNMTVRHKRLPIAPITNIQSGYAHLTQKAVSAFLFVYENYFHDFDWFVKADDDTYLIVDNLKDFLRKQDTLEPVTFGYNYKVFVPEGYHSGGASYVLSREALRRFYKAHHHPGNKTCSKDGGMEDIEIARCLREQGVYVGKSLDEENRELFHPLSFSQHFLGLFPPWLDNYAENPLKTHYNCCSERSISFHYVKPAEQYLIDFLVYGLNP